jgi:hypothetical protein
MNVKGFCLLIMKVRCTSRMCKALQNRLRYLIYERTSKYEDEGKIAL